MLDKVQGGDILLHGSNTYPKGKEMEKKLIVTEKENTMSKRTTILILVGFVLGGLIIGHLGTKWATTSGAPTTTAQQTPATDMAALLNKMQARLDEMEKSAKASSSSTPAEQAEAAPEPYMEARNAPRRGRENPAEIAARAYESLGAAPTGGKIKNHQTVEGKNTSFVCPDGSPGKLVNRVDEDGHGMNHARWGCPHR